MSDFWGQLIQYNNTIGDETPDITSTDRLLSKILNHAEQERQSLEAQVNSHEIFKPGIVLSLYLVQSKFDE